MPELHCRYGLTLARHCGIITSLDLLAVLRLMQSRTCLPSLLLECSPLLALVQLAVHQHSQSLFHRAASHTICPQPFYCSVGLFQVQNFILVQFLLSHLCMVSLSSGPFTSSQFRVTHKFCVGAIPSRSFWIGPDLVPASEELHSWQSTFLYLSLYPIWRKAD